MKFLMRDVQNEKGEVVKKELFVEVLIDKCTTTCRRASEREIEIYNRRHTIAGSLAKSSESFEIPDEVIAELAPPDELQVEEAQAKKPKK